MLSWCQSEVRADFGEALALVDRFDQDAILLLAFVQPLFGLLAVGHVAPEYRQSAVGYWIRPHLEPAAAFPFPRVSVLQGHRHAVGHGLLEQTSELQLFGSWIDLPVRAPDNLLAWTS